MRGGKSKCMSHKKFQLKGEKKQRLPPSPDALQKGGEQSGFNLR